MRSKLSPLIIFTSLLALVAIALALRIIPPYSQIFSDGWVKFTSPDTYYFMRAVDNLVPNFPNLMPVDPYFALSGGMGGGELNFFVYLISAVTLLVGTGSPSPEVIDMVGVYFPAVIGALTVIPGYFLGAALFNRWGGLLAAGLLAIMPGEYLARSELGSTDRDCLQVFLVVVTMLFTVLAVKCARENELFAKSPSRSDRRAIVQALTYSLLAGISLGLLLLTWKGAFVFSAIILAFIIIQSVTDCLRRRPANYLFFTGTVIFLAAATIYLPFVHNTTYRATIILEPVIVIAAALVNRLVVGKDWRPFHYPLLLAILGTAMLGATYLTFPNIFEGIKSLVIRNLFPTALSQTVAENLPILFPAGQFSLYALWMNYTTGFYLSIIGIVIIAFRVGRDGRPGFTFLLVWSVIILVLTLVMRRFAVFYAANVALLSAYVCLRFFEYLGIAGRESATAGGRAPPQKLNGRDKKSRSLSRGRAPLTSLILGILPVLLLVYLPNIPTSIYVSGSLTFVPGNAWCQSLEWLKNNTPDPYGNPDFYYEDYAKVASKKELYPASNYAVTAWWEYGYWIVRMGHRLPNCHPGGGNRGPVAKFFIERNMDSAYKKAESLRSKYVMLDYETTTVMSGGILLNAGVDRTQFYDGYYRPIPGTRKLEPVVLYHPDYYRTLAVRLYNFDGAAVTPQSCQVIAWEERESVEGKYKHLVSSRTFQSYEEAVEFMSSQKAGNYLIAGEDPFKSPVPLAAVEGYRLAFSSDGKVQLAGGSEQPEVKVFEYVK